MTSKPAHCRSLKQRVLTPGLAVALSALVCLLMIFAHRQTVGEAAAQGSSEVYRRVYNGWKWTHVYCFRCHGENVAGTLLAPDLTDPNKTLTHEEFLRVVREGTADETMPGWSKLLEDKQITDIYAYVMARTARVLPVGRPDEVGENGGPWIPPEGWPEAPTEIFSSTVPREAPEMSDDPAASTVASEDVPSTKTDLAGTPEENLETANPLMDAFRSSYQTVRLNLMATAEAMPEEHYDFRLSPAQPAFEGWIREAALLNYRACARMRSVARPEPEALDKVIGKEELTKALRESFEFCDTAAREMNDERALTELKVEQRTTYPVRPMFGLLSSLNSHYGTLVGYLRARGIVPPPPARDQWKNGLSQ